MSIKQKQERARQILNKRRLDGLLSWDLPKEYRTQTALKCVRYLISFIGENPDREGLIKTPERFLNAWKNDWGRGYDKKWEVEQIKSILNGQFGDGAEDYDEMICVRGIDFHSKCEHHMADFNGICDIAYIPAKNGRILGLSKLPRIVELYARRLQVQERLTKQIAEFINKYCKPIGVGVVIKARHSCMCSRGVKQHGTEAITSKLFGEFLTEPEVRSEFLRLSGR